MNTVTKLHVVIRDANLPPHILIFYTHMHIDIMYILHMYSKSVYTYGGSARAALAGVLTGP